MGGLQAHPLSAAPPYLDRYQIHECSVTLTVSKMHERRTDTGFNSLFPFIVSIENLEDSPVNLYLLKELICYSNLFFINAYNRIDIIFIQLQYS